MSEFPETCPKCGAAWDAGGARSCWNCGHDLFGAEVVPMPKPGSRKRKGRKNTGTGQGEPGDDAPVMPPPDNPMAVARQLLASRAGDALRSWRAGWMTWRGPCWAEHEGAEVRAWIYHELEHARYFVGKDDAGNSVYAWWKPTRHKLANVMEALAAVVHLPEAVSPPAWIAGNGPVPPAEIVSAANGLLHVGTRELLPHQPGYFNLVSVPFAYDPGAPPPERWVKFLGELWADDADAITALQEWFGYVLSGRTDLHKILLLVGPLRGGKGTIARVLAAMLGAANVAGPTLASLGTNFGLSPLLGRPLAIVSDARLAGEGTARVVERLLSVSGEDRITVDRKYREPWTGTLPTRFVIMSNELPEFGDASGAIASRFVVLILTESWLGRENTRLTAELLADLPGILNWALEGLDRLSRNGALTEPASSADAVSALADLASPVAAFVRECCQRGGEVPVHVLYARWRSWCDDNGHRGTSKQVFGRDLRSVVPSLRVARPRHDGDRERRYIGVSIPVTGVRPTFPRDADHRGPPGQAREGGPREARPSAG
jgi:putative DNA primase/helicase